LWAARALPFPSSGRLSDDTTLENRPKNRADRDWAEWIAGAIESAGYEPIIQAWDFRPRRNFVLRVQEATAQTDFTLAVLSEAYLQAPEEKDSKVRLYPWGTMWPPPPGAGNYCGVEAKIGNEPKGLIVIEGYNDGYPRTSPVESFPPNKYGLYDMGGNVWQCCEDWYNPEKVFRVLRGASWYDYDPERIFASFRRIHTPDRRGADAGFRCVLARESSR